MLFPALLLAAQAVNGLVYRPAELYGELGVRP